MDLLSNSIQIIIFSKLVLPSVTGFQGSPYESSYGKKESNAIFLARGLCFYQFQNLRFRNESAEKVVSNVCELSCDSHVP